MKNYINHKENLEEKLRLLHISLRKGDLETKKNSNLQGRASFLDFSFDEKLDKVKSQFRKDFNFT